MEPASKTEITKSIHKIKHIFDFVIRIRWLVSAAIALVVFLALKRFAFDIVRVNNHDMEDTYSYGDALLLKKIANSYALNDIVYFEYPFSDSLTRKTFLLQRIMGLPGDSVEISDKLVYVNGISLTEAGIIKHNYIVKTKNIKLDSAFLLKYNMHEGGIVSNEFDYSYSLTQAEADTLRKDSLIVSVDIKMEKKNNFDETCFPGNVNYRWNLDQYGKIYVPKMNDTLKLDSVNIRLYSTLITTLEKNTLNVTKDSILINGTLSKQYVVKKDYYFVLGDNRDNSNDSRVWGFLPDNCILGKVNTVIRRKK